MIDRYLDRVARILLMIAAALGFLLSFLVCADVIGRVIFNSPVKGTPEMVSMAIVIIAYLQAAYAIRSGGMIGVDAL
ncbi:MAG: TRAP transporter small permease subunit, partial [Alphaproteobacteria bacterium]|nr:TRAP transporter small permease subunit [Alphaproteobacteria bacterium]